ncbi:MAG: 3-deoxy-D-manno-octulosonate 8-phosphate phosphatase [Chlorobiaceae bacterium]|nr:3-deoxy-D-manno-octulosonate 8-phosphate phosphatase [Chlorobiaceae bacterium]NTV60726.1 3-deoxy-D-manno-octulosonate 8-phosphate phosphatase [Chlorobiaceae bacterium]
MEPSVADPSSRIDQALKLVRAIVFPVDGVLNGGRITFDSCGKELCSISVRDAFAIKEALGQGMYVAAVSDRNADGYRPVLEQLGVSDLFFGRPDLLSAYEDFRQARGLGDEECAYIGDDVGDVAVLEKAGFPATPIDGADYLRNRVAYISGFEGGKGCIREIVEMLLARQGKWPYAEEMQEGI